MLFFSSWTYFSPFSPTHFLSPLQTILFLLSHLYTILSLRRDVLFLESSILRAF